MSDTAAEDEDGVCSRYRTECASNNIDKIIRAVKAARLAAQQASIFHPISYRWQEKQDCTNVNNMLSFKSGSSPFFLCQTQ